MGILYLSRLFYYLILNHCMNHHSIWLAPIRLSRLRESDDTCKNSFLPRFGSRFRYSGRTMFQARQASKGLGDRNTPYVDRSVTGGHYTGSRSMEGGSLFNTLARLFQLYSLMLLTFSFLKLIFTHLYTHCTLQIICLEQISSTLPKQMPLIINPAIYFTNETLFLPILSYFWLQHNGTFWTLQTGR